MDHLAIFFINAQETAAAHRRFEGSGDFHHLIVIEDIRIHALAGAFQRQLLDVVIGVTGFMIQAVADGKDQFREHGGFAVFAKPRNTVTQNRLLDQAGFPRRTQPETEGNKRRLTVGGVQCVDFIFQRLEGVITLFLGAVVGKGFDIGNLPLFGGLAMFVETGGDERCQHFINTINGGAAVNVAGDLRDNLRGDGGGGGNRLRRINFRIAHFETVIQHAFQVNQHAVKHREERRVIEVMIVDFAALVRQHHFTR